MRTHSGNKHVVDILFPVALFFSFALCALAVILFAARIYRSTVNASHLNETSRTSLYYITEKIHQNDSDGAVQFTTFKGCDALCLIKNRNNEQYCTYIYVYDNELKEILVKAGNEELVDAASGSTILHVRAFTMDRPSDGLFRFSCTDDEGHVSTVVTHLKSE